MSSFLMNARYCICPPLSSGYNAMTADRLVRIAFRCRDRPCALQSSDRARALRTKVNPMAEKKDELLQHYRRTREGLMSAINGLSDEQMSEPSLDGWSVKDHLAHLALWDDLRAMEVERVSAGHESAWKFSEAQEDAYNEVGYELRRSMSA